MKLVIFHGIFLIKWWWWWYCKLVLQ